MSMSVGIAVATFRSTPNNSNAQWCGNSGKSNETDKMTYFTEKRGVVVVIRFTNGFCPIEFCFCIQVSRRTEWL